MASTFQDSDREYKQEHHKVENRQADEVRPNVSVSYHRTAQESAVRAQYRKIEEAQRSVLVLETCHCLIEYVETDGEYVLSAGREYVIDVWDASIGSHLRSLSGHNGPVRGIALLSSYRSQELARKSGYRVSERIVVSASQDQTIRLWSLHRGEQLKCLNTGSSITCFGLMNQILAITGNENGQLEVRHLGVENKHSTTEAHGLPIDALSVEGLCICSATFQPPTRIKVWQLYHGQLVCMYSSEEALDVPMEPMQASSLALHDDVVIIGNARATSLHFINWKTNHRARLRTAGSSSERLDGYIQQIRVKDDLLLASSMVTLDGKVIVDVYIFPDYEHLCTFSCEIKYVLALSYAKSENNIKFVLGGSSLLVLDLLLPLDENKYQLPVLRCEGGENAVLNKTMRNRSLFTDTNVERADNKATKLRPPIQESKASGNNETNIRHLAEQEKLKNSNAAKTEKKIKNEKVEVLQSVPPRKSNQNISLDNDSTNLQVSCETKPENDTVFPKPVECNLSTEVSENNVSSNSQEENASFIQNRLRSYEQTELKNNEECGKICEESRTEEIQIIKNTAIGNTNVLENSQMEYKSQSPKSISKELYNKKEANKGKLTNPRIELILENSGFIKEKVQLEEMSPCSNLTMKMANLNIQGDNYTKLNKSDNLYEDSSYSKETGIPYRNLADEVEQESDHSTDTSTKNSEGYEVSATKSKRNEGDSISESLTSEIKNISDNKHTKNRVKMCTIF